MRNFEQSMGLWLNEPFLLAPELIAPAVDELADAGYEIVRIFLRESNYTWSSPRVVEAARIAAAAAHRRGMKIAMDFEPHVMIATEMGNRYPDTTAMKLVRVDGRVENGFWEVRIPIPGQIGAHSPLPDGVEAAFLDGEPVDVGQAVFANSGDNYGAGDTVDELSYVEGRPGRGPGRNWTLRGRLAAGTEGNLTIFFRVRDLGQVDFAAPAFKRYYTEILELYRDCDLDGVGWDEPAIHNDWSAYRYGDRFAEFFNARCGYALRDKLMLMEGPLTPEAVGVRLDYYQTLNEALLEAQRHFIAEGARIFGKPMISGTHHTWQGEGGSNDFRAGAVDYFRLGEILDAGYTDCSWWDHRSVSYSYLLADSLARLSPSGEAVVNTWHQKPTVRNTRYNARLMSLYRITWFNIWYGVSTDTCLFPGHHTWPEQAAGMRRNRDFLRGMGGAKPLTEIAVLHDWAAVCAVNTGVFADLHKGMVMNLATDAVDGSLPMSFVDARLIADSTIENGRLCNRSGDYGVVVVPDAPVMDRAVWEKLLAFGKAGGKVIFAGAPPTLTVEGGDLTADFGRLFGIGELGFARYHRWFEANGRPLPACRPTAYDAVYPLAGKRVRPDGEDRPAIVESADGNFVYFSGYQADRDVAAWCRALWTPPVKVIGDAQYRFYRNGSKICLAAIATGDSPLDLVLDDGKSLRRAGGDFTLWLEL